MELQRFMELVFRFECATDLEISSIVVTNNTGFGLFAINVVGFVHTLEAMQHCGNPSRPNCGMVKGLSVHK